MCLRGAMVITSSIDSMELPDLNLLIENTPLTPDPSNPHLPQVPFVSTPMTPAVLASKLTSSLTSMEEEKQELIKEIQGLKRDNMALERRLKRVETALLPTP